MTLGLDHQCFSRANIRCVLVVNTLLWSCISTMCSHRFLDLFRSRQGGPRSVHSSARRGHTCDHFCPLASPQSSSSGLLLSFTLFIQHLTSPRILSHLKFYCTIFSISGYVGFKEGVGQHQYRSCAPPPRESRPSLVQVSMRETVRD